MQSLSLIWEKEVCIDANCLPWISSWQLIKQISIKQNIWNITQSCFSLVQLCNRKCISLIQPYAYYFYFSSPKGMIIMLGLFGEHRKAQSILEYPENENHLQRSLFQWDLLNVETRKCCWFGMVWNLPSQRWFLAFLFIAQVISSSINSSTLFFMTLHNLLGR